MNLENVSREDWVVGGLALLLAIFLVILPWFSIGVGPLTFDFSATGAPDGWLGILAFVVALVLVADLAVERFSPQTQIPAIGGSRANTRFILAVIAAAFLLLKFLFHIGDVGNLGWGFFVDLIVTAALVYFALQVRSGAPVSFSRPSRPGAPGGPLSTQRTPPASTPGTPPPTGTPDPAGTPDAAGAGSVTGRPSEGPGGSTPPPRV